MTPLRRILALGLLALSSLHATEPMPHLLVNLATIDRPPLEEIRYATTNNFTGRQLYPFPGAYARREVAAAIEKVQKELAAEGLGLKVYDAYRPLSVQQRMWDLIQDERYVSNPAKNKGRHTRGTAIDVTLVDKLGNELPMPTTFDDFTTRAHRDSTEWTPEQRKNSLLLEAVMKKHGFIPYPYEWWHFDFADWEKYPPLDISIKDLADGVKVATPVQ